MLYEVHKFSKFIHGCSVLLPEDVQSVPYWVDDVSLRDSIVASGGQRILVDETQDVGPGSNELYEHLLPFGNRVDDRRETAAGRTSNSAVLASGGAGALNSQRMQRNMSGGAAVGAEYYNEADQEDEEILCGDWCGPSAPEGEGNSVGWCFPFCSRNNNAGYAENSVIAPTSVQKIEPKVFFANERTFLSWMRYSILLASVASGLLAFASDNDDETGKGFTIVYAFALLFVALLFCAYALHVFLWRADRIKTRIPGRWDDPRGPLLLGSVLVLVLALNFCLQLYELVIHLHHHNQSSTHNNSTTAEL
uniref:DUF202 domain-containing protein n=1 Tax=Cyclophora tenuis TaxID=216820 RepID=A0A6U1R975_CYCTE